MGEEFMHKNRLQEYAQKSSIRLPIYCTINEGSQHKPEFRATVTVDGMIFSSPNTFSSKKAAEQCVAKYALENIVDNIKTKGVPVIQSDTIFCKSVLHEYAAKMYVKMPTYETSQCPGPLPSFASTVCFDNKIFKGGIAKSKKEAEQIAARAVIEFMLGNSDACTTISQIVKSKDRLYATLGKDNGVSSVPSGNAVIIAPNTSNTNADGMEVQATVICNVSHDGTSTTTVDQSIHPEACKQNSELENADVLNLGDTVKNSLPTGDVSGNDIGVPHIQNLAEDKTEVTPYDAGSPSRSCGVAVPITVGQQNGSQSRDAVVIGPSISNISAERKEVQAAFSYQTSDHVAYPKSFPKELSNVAASQSISLGACNQSSDVISNQRSLPTWSNAEAVTAAASTSHVSRLKSPGEVKVEVPLYQSGEASCSNVMVTTASKKRSRRRRKGSSSKKKARGD